MNIKIHNHYIVLLIRTLLWEAGDSDKFVGADLSTETNWKHQTVKLPVQSVESQVCKKQPCEYYVYTKALQKHWWPGNWLLCQSSWRNHSKLNIAKGHFYLSKFFRSKQKLQQSLNSWSNWPRPVEFLTSCHPTPSLPPKKYTDPKRMAKMAKTTEMRKIVIVVIMIVLFFPPTLFFLWNFWCLFFVQKTSKNVMEHEGHEGGGNI